MIFFVFLFSCNRKWELPHVYLPKRPLSDWEKKLLWKGKQKFNLKREKEVKNSVRENIQSKKKLYFLTNNSRNYIGINTRNHKNIDQILYRLIVLQMRHFCWRRKRIWNGGWEINWSFSKIECSPLHGEICFLFLCVGFYVEHWI